MIFGFSDTAWGQVVPAVKEEVRKEGELILEEAHLEAESDSLAEEAEMLSKVLQKNGVALEEDGTPIRLRVEEFSVPARESAYREEIVRQAYRLTVDDTGVVITGRSPQGVFYGIQTLDQLLRESRLPHVKMTDWPDLPVRMIMVDPARQNEKMKYYHEVIRFAARYKINAILCHLTDDQTSTLYHEDYPELMHPQAWRPEQIRDLVALAEEHHVQLIPEIESLGHSRMFTRMEDYKDYLHQTEEGRADHGWTGTDLEGYTNVLCPASEKAQEYLEKMYTRATETFESPLIHVGCDEVDMTECERCQAAYGDLSPQEWILKALMQNRSMALAETDKMGLWGDMLLHYREVTNDLPTTDTVIFDWHYRPEVSADPAIFFKNQGYEVIASPALVCYPHMLLPDDCNYTNIRRFTQIAREQDLKGVNTTIWIPTRYMSDVLWTGIAYSASHAWGGSNWNEEDFFTAFMRDHFGSDRGTQYQKTSAKLTSIIWHLEDFYTSCWADEESFESARQMVKEQRGEISDQIQKLDQILEELNSIGNSVEKNRTDWQAIERSAWILRYTMQHLLASPDVRDGEEWNKELVRELDKKCQKAIEWIEEDWDKNRYADDPNKEGLYLANQHLLGRMQKVHQYHQEILDADQE